MVSLRSLASSLALLALAHSATFSSTQAIEPAATIGRDQAVSYAVNATARQPWTQTISVAGAKYLSVHFSQFRLADGDVVTLTDASGAVTAQYSGLGRGDLGDKGGFYSTQIYSSKVTVQYTPSAVTPVGGDYGFAIDKVVRSASSASVSSVCGTSQLEPPKCFVSDARVPSAYTKSQAVARLTLGGKGCSGWLVGNEGHLLTNFHCIASQAEASNTQYEFGAESPTCDDQCLTLDSCRGTVVATSATFVGGDEAHDYALVKLNASAAALAPYGFLTLRVAGGVNQEQIYIPQHPGGRAKSLAVTVDSGEVARATMGVSNICGSYRVGYDADTEPGSSGSPVLAASDNAVIALHSCGTEASGNCTNSGLDVRSLIFDLRAKNIVPGGALDDPNAVIPNGPWIPTTPAPTTPGPVTPTPTLDICPGFKSVSSCQVFTAGRCLWVDGTCVKNPNFVPPTPAPTTPAPTAPEPTTPAPTTPEPTTPEPTTPAPTTPAPTTPAPTTPAPTTPAPTTPAPTTPAPTTPAPTTPAPTTPAPTTPTPTTAQPTPTPVPTIDICPGFISQLTCEGFTKGKCKWLNGKCVKRPSDSPTVTPAPTTVTPAPTTVKPTPTTPSPTTPAPTTAPVATPTPASRYDGFCKPFPKWFCFGLCKWDGSQPKCVGI